MASCYPPVPLSHSSRSQISSVIVTLSLRAFIEYIEYRKGISFTQSTQTIHKIGIEGSTTLNYRYPADGVCHDRVYQASIRRNHTSQYPVRSRTPLTSTLVDPLLCVQLFFFYHNFGLDGFSTTCASSHHLQDFTVRTLRAIFCHRKTLKLHLANT